MRRAKSSLLVPILLLAGCAGGMHGDHRAATAHHWDFELTRNAYAVSVSDVAQIRNRALTSAFDHSRIMKMEVVDLNTVWVRRGDRYGGPSEYWTRNDRGNWRKSTPPNLSSGTVVYWAPNDADEQWGFRRVALPPRRQQTPESAVPTMEPVQPIAEAYPPALRAPSYAPVQHAPLYDAAFLREEYGTPARVERAPAPVQHTSVAAQRVATTSAVIPAEWQPAPVLAQVHSAPVHTPAPVRPSAIISSPAPNAAKPVPVAAKPIAIVAKTEPSRDKARQTESKPRIAANPSKANRGNRSKPEMKIDMLTAPNPVSHAPRPATNPPLIPQYAPF